MIPAALTKSMKEKISNSKIVIFDDEGHVPFFENSNGFNNELEIFIKEIL